jgi:hypothetical protein
MKGQSSSRSHTITILIIRSMSELSCTSSANLNLPDWAWVFKSTRRPDLISKLKMAK